MGADTQLASELSTTTPLKKRQSTFRETRKSLLKGGSHQQLPKERLL